MLLFFLLHRPRWTQKAVLVSGPGWSVLMHKPLGYVCSHTDKGPFRCLVTRHREDGDVRLNGQVTGNIRQTLPQQVFSEPGILCAPSGHDPGPTSCIQYTQVHIHFSP